MGRDWYRRQVQRESEECSDGWKPPEVSFTRRIDRGLTVSFVDIIYLGRIFPRAAAIVCLSFA